MMFRCAWPACQSQAVSLLSNQAADLQCIQCKLNCCTTPRMAPGRMSLTRTVFVDAGKEIALDERSGIFITMNPGYAGRTELPDNLKALFRPVTMVVPDLEQICEIMLFSEGFDTAKVHAWHTFSHTKPVPVLL